MNTKNWRIRHIDENMFFIEGDLPNAEQNGHYPRVEVMMEDFGEHNGYTKEIRMVDAELIISAPNMRDAINDVLETIDGDGVPNIEWIKDRLSKSLEITK